MSEPKILIPIEVYPILVLVAIVISVVVCLWVLAVAGCAGKATFKELMAKLEMEIWND